jgi:hypothetical protein
LYGEIGSNEFGFYRLSHMKQRDKVFCIGFHKTGTTSLGGALVLFGRRNCMGASKVGKVIGKEEMFKRLYAKDYSDFYKLALDYDVFYDNPWFSIYPSLDVKFPGSKFILMIRDEDSWLKSCVNYFGTSTSPFRKFIYGAEHGSPIGNEEEYLKRYQKHNNGVLAYFKDRPDDLLVLSLKDEDKMARIADFIGEPIPDAAYPHLNSTSK